ncbi:hypothetical protein GCM10028773_44280 [Spirosoma koreense]
MSNGKPRPLPCEFEIMTLWLMGKNNEVLGKITPGNTTIKLPKSKAVSNSKSSIGESYVYTVSVDFRRINPAAYPPKKAPFPGLSTGFYTVSTSTVTDPISPPEIKTVKKVDVSPNLPKPGLRPNRVTFPLQLNYGASGGQLALTWPVQYIQIANPLTFQKIETNTNKYRDKAEAYITFSVDVDFTK